MASSKSTTSLFFLAFSLALQTAIADSLFHLCSTPENFTANGPYHKNLNTLLTSLQYKAPPTGFGLGSYGQTQDLAYGLALCRGDVSAIDCKTCIAEASGEIRKHCPYNKGSIIWYDNCLVKYLDKDFFGQIDNRNQFYLYNVRNVSEPLVFNQKTKELLSYLANQAYVTPKLYATGEKVLGESKKLYGLTQCTRDLSSVDCKKCLEGIIGKLPTCCDGKEGGRVLTGSCNFRYEIYPFVNV